MASPHLTVETEDGIGRIVMNRPERYNAMDEEMATALAETIASLTGTGARDVESDGERDGERSDGERGGEIELGTDDLRCLVLTGTEGAFNTGADLSTFDADHTDATTLDAIATPLHEAVSGLMNAPIPVIVGVNGVVAGGGLGLALAGDVVLVSEDARFEYAYPKLGLSGDGGATWFLPRLLGRRRAQQFALLDDPIGAEDAVDLGLATESTPADTFEDRLEELARTLANGPTMAYAEIKSLLREGSTRSLEDHLDVEKERITALAETDDYVAGITGFLEKEVPEFDGQ